MSKLARQLPPLSTLVVFESAVRLLSFSRAADECALSQASVSRQIRQLENNLDIRLFERQRYNVLPTEAGEKLYKSVQRALGDLAATATELRDSAAGQNLFTIYSDLSIATAVVAPLISRFQQLFPDTNFNILSSYEPIEHTRSSFDLGFQMGCRAEDLFDVETIADDLVFPVCSPQFAKSLKSDISAADLCEMPLLHLEYENKHNINWRQFLGEHNIRQCKPGKQLVFNSYQMCLDVAERGEGIALGWKRSVNARIAEGKLIRFTDLSLHVTVGISVYLRKHVDPHPLAIKVIEEVRASLSLETERG